MLKPMALSGIPQGEMKPGFRAAVTTNGEFEILIYDDIGAGWWGGGGITAQNIRASLDAAGAFSRISLRINSPGGDAFEGVAIGNVLKATGKPIDVNVDGIAASAASIVAMCGSTITMANNAMMMVHNAWSICMGYASDMLKMADTLEKISGSISQTYVDRTGKSFDEIKALMDAETWMSAADCVSNGFATAISSAPNEPALAMARGFKVLNQMRHLPESLRNKKKADTDPADKCECDCSACIGGDCGNCSNAECEDANCTDCPMQEERMGAAADVPAVNREEATNETALKRARLAERSRRNRAA